MIDGEEAYLFYSNQFIGDYWFKQWWDETIVFWSKTPILLSSVLLLLFLHCRSNLSHYTTQKTTAFIAPSAAVFYSIYLFNSRHISSLYGIPIILSGEIEGFPCDFKEKTTPYQDLVSLENTETIVRAFVIDDD